MRYSTPNRLQQDDRPRRLSVIIVTVSTSKYGRKVRNEDMGDESGRIARELVKGAGHAVSKTFLISDDAAMLRSLVTQFRAGDDDAIIFVGGTGVSPDDLTIETVRPYLEKEVVGFGEIFRAESYKKIGPPAFLSRATAGITAGKLVVCLPGSPDAVATALGIFIGQFPEIILNARG